MRSQFGAPLSAARAWSAAAILAVPIVIVIVNIATLPGPALSLRVWFDVGVLVLMPIALAARRTWARSFVLGMTLFFLMSLLEWTLLFPWRSDPPGWVWISELGVLAFVMPWKRKEISPAAIALTLQVWAYASVASWGDALFIEAYKMNATIAFVGAIAASIGTVLRARWSAIASAVSALALFGMMFSELGELVMARHPFNVYWVDTFATVSSGAIAASVAAMLCWRTTRSPARRSASAA